MPIKGLTDRGLALPQIGTISKGDVEERTRKDGSKYTVPIDLEYFNVKFDAQEQEAGAIFRKIYGPEPTDIRVMFPFNEIERVWDTWLEGYTASRMVSRSDGEIYLWLRDGITQEILVKNGIDRKTGQPRPYVEGQPDTFYKDSKGNEQPVFCEPTGRLKVVIPELGRMAILLAKTGSIHDVINLSEQLEGFRYLNQGQLAGIPFFLKRRPNKISTPGKNGKRYRRDSWLMSIEADSQWVRAKLADLKRVALPGNGLDIEEPDTPALPEIVAAPPDEDMTPDPLEPDYVDIEPDEPQIPVGLQIALECGQRRTKRGGKKLIDCTPDEIDYVIKNTKSEALREDASVLVNFTDKQVSDFMSIEEDTTMLQAIRLYTNWTPRES